MRFIGPALAFAALLAASPALAQSWGYGPYDGGAYGPGPGRYAGSPYGAGPYGWNDAGEADIAICPPGYHLGRSGRLCWPNR